MSFDANNVNVSQLLQPELLTEDEIRSILIARCIRIDNINSLDKCALLQLFYRIAIPLGQRSRNKFNVNEPNITNSEEQDEHSVKKIKSAQSPSHHHRIQLKRTYDCHKNNNQSSSLSKKARIKICWP